ncbi:unnamed protein product [Candidula unifasciata]|uniref:Very-long-chain (3R)-3-hydroxyacyl-CoA dehydratase n=1 Tax=Candidula unifasciata TaxID=100452 RepID=A0A8S3YUK7_9EUPU|nr:unnamed protein product [Candidula unifasciata]
MATSLSPFVYWGQSKENISLKVDLRSVENVEVSLTEEGLDFSAQGQGIKGINIYSFHLDFYLRVNPEKSRYRKTDTAVEFQIEKSVPETWPRLTSERTKLQWLKIDFDKFMQDESELEDNSDDAATDNSQKELLEKLAQDIETDDSEDGPSLSQVYLFVYNLFQFVGYTYILAILIYNYIRYGQSAKQGAYESVGSQMTVCKIVSILEIFHSLFKLVRTNLQVTVVQVAGQNFILFFLVMQEPRLQISPLCWYLFVAWSAIEVVRYPYYLLQLMNIELKFITWLRYTLWMPLYPFGILTEATITFQSITYFSETGFLSITLPNSANFAFYFPYFLMVYLVLLCVAGSSNLKHMLAQRRKQLSGRGKATASKNKSS